MKQFIVILCAFSFLFSCSVEPKSKKEELTEGLEKINKAAKELSEETKKLTESVDTEDLKELAESLGKLSEKAKKNDKKGDDKKHFEYKPDALWKAAVKNFEAGLSQMPTEGLERTIVSRTMGDKKGETEVVMWGKFLYKDSVMALLPRKVKQKGEVKEVENYEKIANTKARDYKTKNWHQNHSINDACMMSVLRSSHQNKIGVIATGNTESIDGKPCEVYNVSLTGRNGKIQHGKVYIAPTNEMAMKVDFMAKHGSASGGASYMLGEDQDGHNVVKSTTISVKMNMLGLAESTLTTILEFTEYGEVTIE